MSKTYRCQGKLFSSIDLHPRTDFPEWHSSFHKRVLIGRGNLDTNQKFTVKQEVNSFNVLKAEFTLSR